MLKVNEDRHGANPIFLDTLAWAYFRNGDAARVVATEKALGLLPANQPSGIRSRSRRGWPSSKRAR